MNYLYGDSTPSNLTSNFLELLRDALDFAVFVVQADQRIKEGKEKARALTEEARAEIERLERFIAHVTGAVQTADKGAADSPTAHCATRLTEALGGAQRATTESIRNKLAADIAVIDGDEAASRDACNTALAALLGPHTPPDSSTTEMIRLEGSSYDAKRMGHAGFGFDWTFELAIPEGNLFASVVRLDRISQHMEIHAPQVSGWIKKEVKILAQRLERHVVTEMSTAGPASQFKLRVEPAFDLGFDVDVDVEARAIRMVRIGAADDPAAGPFDVAPEDAALMLDLADKLREAASAFTLRILVRAAFDELDFETLPSFVPVVERLVQFLTPIVREVSARSVTPTELVLRRALADDRREEVFLAKSTLREKYALLPAPLRALFSPLALESTVTPAPPPAVPPPIPTVRAELPKSMPPPPRASALPPPRPPPPPRAPTPIPPAAAAAAEPAISAPPASSQEGRNEGFVEAVKKIMVVLKSGATDEGYRQYAELLAGPSFAQYRAEDQRQALKLLLLAKTPPSRSDAVTGAYKVALERIQSLVDSFADPADYEMLGVAQLHLDQRTLASAAFETALKLERARNPSSELCGNLVRRVQQL